MRLLKILVGVVILAFLALTGYAYFGDMAPRQQEMRRAVPLDMGNARTVPSGLPGAADAAAAAPESPADQGAEEADPNGLD
ncbi:MAG: hypothetical protein Q4G26_12800 [Paracoccus sp. (in: a-proteobacteria)]|nr:hypothetical protein [Paracoccus sp. (in: a-proteobacteria)]